MGNPSSAFAFDEGYQEVPDNRPASPRPLGLPRWRWEDIFARDAGRMGAPREPERRESPTLYIEILASSLKSFPTDFRRLVLTSFFFCSSVAYVWSQPTKIQLATLSFQLLQGRRVRERRTGIGLGWGWWYDGTSSSIATLPILNLLTFILATTIWRWSSLPTAGDPRPKKPNKNSKICNLLIS